MCSRVRGNRLGGDFERLLAASAISAAGTAVTTVALPIVALVTLRANTFEVGVISAAGLGAWLLFGLSAGVWVERMRRRPLMIICDLARAVALASIPLASVLHLLTVAQVVIAALVVGICSVFFDIAGQSYVPSIVAPSQLLAGNGRMQVSHAAAGTAGPALGGALVQSLGASLSLLADVLSYVVSAVLLARVGKREAPAVRSGPRRMLPQVKEGLGYVWRDPVFRPLMVVAAISNLFGAAFDTLVVPFLLRDVGVSAVAIGVLLAIGGVGGLLGAAVGPSLADKVGGARVLVVAAIAGPLLGLLVPTSRAGVGLVAFVVGLLGREVGIAIVSLLARTIRQLTAPPELLARITATVRFVSWGVLPIGALIGGSLGQLMGPRVALSVVSGLMLLSALPIAFMSPRALQALMDDATAALPRPVGSG
ncbi:MFS transporter [Nocardia sp. NPDC049190]|uniref:MFS transporter n=1 Tax=Nocardia sp. NPDC049190 TaxID=3155650 RepID=UPI00340E0AD2